MLTQDQIWELAGRGASLKLSRDTFFSFRLEWKSVELECLTDVYLACACANQVPGAADELVFKLRPELRRRLLPELGGDGALTDDAIQLAFQRLLASSPPGIQKYSGRGSLLGWMLVITLRCAAELKRNAASRPYVQLEDVMDLALEESDPDLTRRRGRATLKTAFQNSVSEMEPRLKTVLRLNVLEGMNIDEIGMMYGVHRATVARWIHDAKMWLQSSIRKKLMHQVGIDELESFLRLADHRLELSLSANLRSLGNDSSVSESE